MEPQMPQLPTIGFLLSLMIESSNLVVSRAPYTTGAPQWPKGGCRPYFSIDLAFYQCSGGVIAINECRRKSAANFRLPFRPCAGKRIFYNIPGEYLEFCIDFARLLYQTVELRDGIGELLRCSQTQSSRYSMAIIQRYPTGSMRWLLENSVGSCSHE
jgi:hypothetical protein